MYGFAAEDFRRQIVHLKRLFHFISWRDVQRPGSIWSRRSLLLTFDDGLRNNATIVAPMLRELSVPAVFFVSSRHFGGQEVLWFSYLAPLEHEYDGREIAFRGVRYDISGPNREQSLQLLASDCWPEDSSAMYDAIRNELPPIESFVGTDDIEDRYAGMTAAHVAELDADDLFSVECHTVDHPYLTRCKPQEAERQIAQNKADIEPHLRTADYQHRLPAWRLQ